MFNDTTDDAGQVHYASTHPVGPPADERIRMVALDSALRHYELPTALPASLDEVVAAAETFRRFLASEAPTPGEDIIRDLLRTIDEAQRAARNRC